MKLGMTAEEVKRIAARYTLPDPVKPPKIVPIVYKSGRPKGGSMYKTELERLKARRLSRKMYKRKMAIRRRYTKAQNEKMKVVRRQLRKLRGLPPIARRMRRRKMR